MNMNQEYSYWHKNDAWNLFYFRAKPIIYKKYGSKSKASIDKIEKAFLKVSIENPDINPAHYDSVMTRLMDLLELNAPISLHEPAEDLLDTYYNPN